MLKLTKILNEVQQTVNEGLEAILKLPKPVLRRMKLKNYKLKFKKTKNGFELNEPAIKDKFIIQRDIDPRTQKPMWSLTMNGVPVDKQTAVNSKQELEDTIKNKILNEETIGKYRKKIDIVYDIDKSKHAGDRQTRHGDDDFISDGEIKELTNRAINKIAQALLFDDISIGDYIHLKDTKSALNIVGHVEEEGDRIKILIVTIMKKQNFKAKSGTKTIKV